MTRWCWTGFDRARRRDGQETRDEIRAKARDRVWAVRALGRLERRAQRRADAGEGVDLGETAKAALRLERPLRSVRQRLAELESLPRRGIVEQVGRGRARVDKVDGRDTKV